MPDRVRGLLRAAAIVFAAVLWTTAAIACDVAATEERAALDQMRTAWAARCTHPLCGRIVETVPSLDPCNGGTNWTMTRDVSAADLVLFGEVHDNPLHHQFRARLLRFRKAGAAAVFEHIRTDQQKGLDEFKAVETQARRLGTANDLFGFLDWDRSGWPDKAEFAPLFDAVIGAKLPIYAGDPARADIKKVAKEGEAALPELERHRLGLDAPFPAVAQETLLDDLEKSHCGLMPKTAFGNLAYAQRYRDAYLADVVLKAASEHGSAMLFAGNGHVRADRGVPRYLRQRAPDKTIVTVMLLEVEEGQNQPEDYDLKGPDGKPVADYVVFTPRAERPDPCIEMKKMFEKRGKR